MSFWKSDRIEYLKQPHIAALVVIVVSVISIVTISSIVRISEINRQNSLGVEEKCLKYVPDEILCKYAAANQDQASSNYKSVSTEITGSQTEITTTISSGPDRLSSQTIIDNQVVSEYVLLDSSTYAKDYEDGYWARFIDSSYQPTDQETLYDFSSDDSTDVITFRDRYKRLGTETCDNLNCYKYQIMDPEDEKSLIYAWIDDQDYLLRKYTAKDDESSLEIEYSYGSYEVNPPEPTKDATEEEIINLLGI